MKANGLRKTVLILLFSCLVENFIQTGTAKEKIPPTKSIRGHVADAKKKSITGAKVFITNVNKKITTVLITDESGLYGVYGLDPKVDYEVHAEYGKMVSEKKTVSSFLNRFDNVFNFELEPGKGSGALTSAKLSGSRVEIRTADQVKLVATWISPLVDKNMKLPAVLLVHGFGQDRHVWEDFARDHLLPAGFASLSLDLRGHGDSVEQAGTKIRADRALVSEPKQFPLDIDAAVRWLKSREDVDVNRIGMVGCDLGADLVFLASGKYEDVRSGVALSGNAENARHLASGIENLQAHSILYIATEGDKTGAESAVEFEN